jgi:excisionase family DNA binding protein
MNDATTSGITEGLIPDSPLLTVAEVAERLDVTETTVRLWLRDDQLKAHKRKGRWMVREDDLAGLMRGRRVVEMGEMTVTEAAEMLDLHTATIRIWIREGLLDARHDGRKYFVRGEALKRLLDENPRLGTPHRMSPAEQDADAPVKAAPPPLRRRRRGSSRALATEALAHLNGGSDG